MTALDSVRLETVLDRPPSRAMTAEARWDASTRNSHTLDSRKRRKGPMTAAGEGRHGFADRPYAADRARHGRRLSAFRALFVRLHALCHRHDPGAARHPEGV